MARTNSIRKRRGSRVVGILILVFLVVLAVPSVMSWVRSREGGTEEYPEPSAPSATYRSNEPFELTGIEGERDANGNALWDSWEFDKNWMWLGTMRFTVSDPVVYDSAEEAGITSYDAEDFKVVVVDMTIENVDAVCREEVVAEQGAPAMLLTMFRMYVGEVRPDYYDSVPQGARAEYVGCDAAPVDGLIYQGGQASGYVWVEPGESVDVRLGYRVTEWEEPPFWAIGGTSRQVDAASADLTYLLTIDMGWSDGAPVVELGPATKAERG